MAGQSSVVHSTRVDYALHADLWSSQHLGCLSLNVHWWQLEKLQTVREASRSREEGAVLLLGYKINSAFVLSARALIKRLQAGAATELHPFNGEYGTDCICGPCIKSSISLLIVELLQWSQDLCIEVCRLQASQ